jgi:tRNA(adenine34) deaminase
MELPRPIQHHQRFMQQAIVLAEQARDEGEVPVGAVVVHNSQIIGRGYNQTELLKDATAHAEMIALSAAMSTLKSKYLNGCTIYVTLEPCPMCAGALVWSKIDRLVYGTSDIDAGACGSLFDFSSKKRLNHQFEVIQGILERDCKWIIQQFFSEKRSKTNGSS